MADPVVVWQMTEIIRHRVIDSTISDILLDIWVRNLEDVDFAVSSEETLIWKDVVTINGWRDAALRHYRDLALQMFGGVRLRDETALFERVDYLFTSTFLVFQFAFDAYKGVVELMTNANSATGLIRTMKSKGRVWVQGDSYNTNANRLKVLVELQHIIDAYIGDTTSDLSKAIHTKTTAITQFVKFVFRPANATERDNRIKALRNVKAIDAARILFDPPRTAPDYILERYEPLAAAPVSTSVVSSTLVSRLFPGFPAEDTRAISSLLVDLLDAYPMENGSWGDGEETALNHLKWRMIFALGRSYHGADVNTTLKGGDPLISFRSITEVPSEASLSPYVPEPANITQAVETGGHLRLLRAKQQQLNADLFDTLDDMIAALNQVDEPQLYPAGMVDVAVNWQRLISLATEFADTYAVTHRHLPSAFYDFRKDITWMKSFDITTVDDADLERAAVAIVLVRDIIQSMIDLDTDPVSLIEETAAIDASFAALYEPANALKEFWRLEPALKEITTVLKSISEGNAVAVRDGLARLDVIWPPYDRLYHSIYTTTPSVFMPIVGDTVRAMLQRQYLDNGNYIGFQKSWFTPRFWTALDRLSRDDPKQAYTRTTARYHPYLPHRYELPDEKVTRYSREMEHIRATQPQAAVEKAPTMLPTDLAWFYANVNGFVAGLQERLGKDSVVRIKQEENNRAPYKSVDQWWHAAKPFGVWKDSRQLETKGEPLFWNLRVILSLKSALAEMNLTAIKKAALHMHGSLSGVEVRLSKSKLTIYYRRVSGAQLAREKRYTDAVQAALGVFTPRVRAIRSRFRFGALAKADLPAAFREAVEN